MELKLAKNDGEFIVKNYADNPAGYCRDVLQYEPDTWQIEALNAIVNNRRLAVSSGHGVGKTRLCASLIHWFISCFPRPQISVTANTEVQLSTKTWRELIKVNQQALNKDWFDYTATKFFLKGEQFTWFAAAIPWSERRPESVAGTHEGHVLYIYDEASAIPDVVWDSCEGIMTTEGARWAAFGNPTRNVGRFADCFGKYRHRWHCMQVDSRTAKMTDKKQLQEWVDDYGEDSDFVRIRVRGVFPRSGSRQLISQDDIDACCRHKAIADDLQPLVFGIDLARSGDCQNVVAMRQGRKVRELIKWRADDITFTVGKIIELYKEHNPDLMFIDGGGLGAPIIDRLCQLIDKGKVYKVIGGAAAQKNTLYFNLRSEMYGNLRDALKDRIEIPDDKELTNDLGMVEYGFDKHNRIQLDRKEDMPWSPDCSDALAMTYAAPVFKQHKTHKRMGYAYSGWMG